MSLMKHVKFIGLLAAFFYAIFAGSWIVAILLITAFLLDLDEHYTLRYVQGMNPHQARQVLNFWLHRSFAIIILCVFACIAVFIKHP